MTPLVRAFLHCGMFVVCVLTSHAVQAQSAGAIVTLNSQYAAQCSANPSDGNFAQWASKISAAYADWASKEGSDAVYAQWLSNTGYIFFQWVSQSRMRDDVFTQWRVEHNAVSGQWRASTSHGQGVFAEPTNSKGSDATRAMAAQDGGSSRPMKCAVGLCGYCLPDGGCDYFVCPICWE